MHTPDRSTRTRQLVGFYRPRRPGRVRTSGRPALGLLALLLLMPWLTACDNNSPTDPAVFSIVLQSELTTGGSVTHLVNIPTGGILNVNLDDLRVLTEDSLLDPVTGFVGFRLGRNLDEGCSVTTELTLRIGDSFTFGLQPREYCFQIFDRGWLGQDDTIEYELLVELR